LATFRKCDHIRRDRQGRQTPDRCSAETEDSARLTFSGVQMCMTGLQLTAFRTTSHPLPTSESRCRYSLFNWNDGFHDLFDPFFGEEDIGVRVGFVFLSAPIVQLYFVSQPGLVCASTKSTHRPLLLHYPDQRSLLHSRPYCLYLLCRLRPCLASLRVSAMNMHPMRSSKRTHR
jgi:hypothetical protein